MARHFCGNFCSGAGTFNQFSVSGGITKRRRSITQVIWFAIVWEIWKERNNKLYNDKESSIGPVLDRIKALAFRWLKVTPSITIVGGLVRSPCVASADRFFFPCFYLYSFLFVNTF